MHTDYSYRECECCFLEGNDSHNYVPSLSQLVIVANVVLYRPFMLKAIIYNIKLLP